MDRWDVSSLDAAGLNLQAVFDLQALPEGLGADLRQFDPSGCFRQLILIGNGGRAMWAAIGRTAQASAHPIDEYGVAVVTAWFRQFYAHRFCELIYPRHRRAVPLQKLGRLAGWHHASPLGVGINPTWGLWFAYRAALLADTDLAPTAKLPGASPCATCVSRDCIAAYPAHAAAPDGLDLRRCVAYRRSPASQCRQTCLAREACPVRAEQRYDAGQLRHCYSISLRAIEQSM
jgi:hypothetical protein